MYRVPTSAIPAIRRFWPIALGGDTYRILTRADLGSDLDAGIPDGPGQRGDRLDPTWPRRQGVTPLAHFCHLCSNSHAAAVTLTSLSSMW